MKREELTQEKLKELLNYDPDTGVFTWKERPLSMFKTTRDCNAWHTKYYNIKAGCKDKNRNTITIFKKHYASRRLAWLYIYGFWPKNDLDPIDGNIFNDAISNLRNETRLDHQHKKIIKQKTKYMQGVKFYKRNLKKPYQAKININGKFTHLGYFSTELEAHQAYVEAKRQVSPEFCML